MANLLLVAFEMGQIPFSKERADLAYMEAEWVGYSVIQQAWMRYYRSQVGMRKED
jgi:hypothetical protein